jgi:hypothetical protein
VVSDAPDADDIEVPEGTEVDVPPEVLAEFQKDLDAYEEELRAMLDQQFASAEDIDYPQDDDIDTEDDASWLENQHPRGMKGSGKGGQFVRKGEGGAGAAEAAAAGRERAAAGREARAAKEEGPDAAPIPEPPPKSSWSKTAAPKLAQLAQALLDKGTDPHEAEVQIMQMASRWKHSGVQGYARKLVAHIYKEAGRTPPKLPPAPSEPEPPKTPPRAIEPPPKLEPPPPIANAPKNIAEVIANRTDWLPRERAYHEQSWGNASGTTMAAVQRTPRLTEISHREKAGAYYMANKHMISMGQPDRGNANTWRHEFGHAMDYGNAPETGWDKKPLSFIRGEEARKKDAASIIERYRKGGMFPTVGAEGALSKTAKQLGLSYDDLEIHAQSEPMRIASLNAVLSGGSLAGWRNVSRGAAVGQERTNFEDFIGSLTGNVVGQGHADSYYAARPHTKCSEAFANYVDLTNGPGGKVYRAVMHSLAPNFCAECDRIIADIGSGKYEQTRKP